MAKQVLIIGLGVFGRALAKFLNEKNIDVIAVDIKEELVEEVKDYVTMALSFDSTNEKALRSINPSSMDVAIVTIGEDFETNLLTSVLLKELAVENVISRAFKPIQKKILIKSGVDSIITPEELVAHILAGDIAGETAIVESYIKKLSLLDEEKNPSE